MIKISIVRHIVALRGVLSNEREMEIF